MKKFNPWVYMVKYRGGLYRGIFFSEKSANYFLDKVREAKWAEAGQVNGMSLEDALKLVEACDA